MRQLALFGAPEAAEVAVEVLSEEEAVAPQSDGHLGGLIALMSGEVRTRTPIGFAFQCMEWAEDAISESKATHPDRADLLHRAFICLRPRYEFFQGRAVEHTIRAHMDELLRRVADHGRDADMAAGTAAEGVTVLCGIATKAPLKHRYFMVAGALFVDAFGEDEAVQILGEEGVRRAQMDRDQDVIAELLSEVLEECRDEDRGKAWRKKMETS